MRSFMSMRSVISEELKQTDRTELQRIDSFYRVALVLTTFDYNEAYGLHKRDDGQAIHHTAQKLDG